MPDLKNARFRGLKIALLTGLLLGIGLLGRAGAKDSPPPNQGRNGALFLPESYVIGTGDLLDISVWKDEALTRTVTVLPDGRIHFPLIGELQAEGKTVNALKTEMEKKIAQYVPDPVLSLNVRQVNSLLIYIIGRVNHPGRFPLMSEINVLQALALAGGLTPFAERKEIKVFRKKGETTLIFPFDYHAVSRGMHLEQNITLKRGDVIVVP